MRASDLSLHGRKLWETMSSHWPTGDQQPNATPAEIEFARLWRDMPKVVFSSTIDKVDWNTRLVTGDAVAEIARLRAEDGGPMDIGGATLAGAAMRAGLIDEYALVSAAPARTPRFLPSRNHVRRPRARPVIAIDAWSFLRHLAESDQGSGWRRYSAWGCARKGVCRGWLKGMKQPAEDRARPAPRKSFAVTNDCRVASRD
jgi:hypothetical protein